MFDPFWMLFVLAWAIVIGVLWYLLRPSPTLCIRCGQDAAEKGLTDMQGEPLCQACHNYDLIIIDTTNQELRREHL